MKIIRMKQDEIWLRRSEYHILTYAEEGFAPLNIHGEPLGLDKSVLVEFAAQINQRCEAGSLHPRAPISAIPRVFIRDFSDSEALKAQITDFLRENRESIKAKKIIVDFRTPSVPSFAVTAIHDAMIGSDATGIDEVVIVD